MEPARRPQLNIRSQYARDRVAALTQETGLSATQIVEEALRAYSPEPSAERLPEGLIRKGRLLVIKNDGPTITLEQANAALDEVRSYDR